jgi:hypothetical protein
LLIRNREYIEFETFKKQCWSYLRNIKTAITYFFYKRFAQNLAKFLFTKNLAEHWDLPNTGIFYSKDVASGASNQYLSILSRTATFTVLECEFLQFPIKKESSLWQQYRISKYFYKEIFFFIQT